ncbi:MAG TPA: cysteine desulfurase [Terriglobales bacterium]|nr:cysteine desulfurase [Terriglobales bacterium]
MRTAEKLSLVEPAPRFDVERIRRDFPILHRQVHGHPLVYLDNAASAQKPKAVIDAMARFDAESYSNVHRGVHFLSETATSAFEAARQRIRSFINAAETREIILVRGTTEAINLVAYSYGGSSLNFGDEVLITALEHHANIVPWQILCQQRGAALRVVPINDQGEVCLDEYRRLIGPRTRIVALAHVSNALGTINPLPEMIAIAHSHGVPVLVDGAQAAPHIPIDVQALDCDFYAFSSHKVYGPTGIGVLYGKAALLEKMPPYQGGGEMIATVTFEKTFYKEIPHKFEAGTPHITGAVGLDAALAYLEEVGIEAAGAYEHELLEYGTALLAEIPEVRMIGTAQQKTGVLSFVIEGIHAHDVGTILDRSGIAVRVGHHCAQPVMQRFKVPATARASLAFYNTRAELDALAAGIRQVIEVFR